MASRKFKITYMICFVFLVDSVGIDLVIYICAGTQFATLGYTFLDTLVCIHWSPGHMASLSSLRGGGKEGHREGLFPFLFWKD